MRTGWLSPNGDFYPCAVYDHVEVAREIIDKVNVQRNGSHHPDEILLSAGWVQISRSAIGIPSQHIYWNKFLTDYQKNFLRPYFEENDELVSSVSRIKWDKETNY